MPDVKITGAKEINRLLSQMPDRVAQRVTENALRAGARVIRDAAKSFVPVNTGDLRDSITVAVTKREGGKKKRDQGVIYVGFQRPTSRRAHLTEFGTSHSAAKPFMRPAIDTKGEEAISKIGEALGKGVEREAAKLAKGFRFK